MTEFYRLSFALEREHARLLHQLLDLTKEEVVPRLAQAIAEGEMQVGLTPEVTAEELSCTFGSFYSLVTEQLGRDGVFDVVCEDRRARILRWIVDYVGTEVVPAVAELVEEGEGSWRYYGFTAEEIKAVYLVFWCLVDMRFPRADGTFDLDDLEIGWQLGLS